MAAKRTANGKYAFDMEIKTDDDKTLTLALAIERVHRVYSELMGWKETKLRPGAYGYDNLAICIGNAVTSGLSPSFQDIHTSWTENYLFWSVKKPWETHGSLYFKPYNDLTGERYVKCATSRYDDLPADEQIKDINLTIAIDRVLPFLRTKKEA